MGVDEAVLQSTFADLCRPRGGIAAVAVRAVRIASAVDEVIDEGVAALTAAELSWIRSQPAPERHLATTLADKAACLAALYSLGCHVAREDVEIARGDEGCPVVRMPPGTAAGALAAGVREVLVSITSDGGTALAVAAASRASRGTTPTSKPRGMLGVGVDLISLAHAGSGLLGGSPTMVRRVFTPGELSAAASLGGDVADPEEAALGRHLLRTLAVKEAAFKSVAATILAHRADLPPDVELDDLSFRQVEVGQGLATRSLVRLRNPLYRAAVVSGVHHVDAATVVDDGFVVAFATSHAATG